MANLIHEWHDFYLLIGTASATLVGLMFVAASVGASYFTTEREVPLRSLLTPTIQHFSAVLVICLMGTAPSQTSSSFGALVSASGVVGIGFACRVWRNMLRRGMTKTLDLADRCCYIVLPIGTYLAVIGTGIVLPSKPGLGLDLLAGLLVVLLLLGIRNAWDMTLWIVLHTDR
ncbi:MAG: hypothetical protein ABI369_03710 [Acetobacteraceae bacterium]